jgi:4'-phosphopantetheinyl transferase
MQSARHLMQRIPLTLLPHHGPADVQVWRVDIDFDVPLDSAIFSALSSDELVRANVFRRIEDALRFATVRAALRQQLAIALALEAHAVRFARDALGRPRLALTTEALDQDGLARIDFNVSHSGAHGLIALSAHRRVGVDIERHDPQLDWRSLAELTLSDGESKWLAPLSDDECLRSFYDAWVAKEALLKATGVGVVRGLSRLTVLPRDGEGVIVRDPLPDEARDLSASWLAAPSGYAACVAWSAFRS